MKSYSIHIFFGMGWERVLYNAFCQRQVNHWGEDNHCFSTGVPLGTRIFVSLLKALLPSQEAMLACSVIHPSGENYL